MAKKLSQELLAKLRPLEEKLKRATRAGEPEIAIELAGQIQSLFENNRRHFRLLRAKLWAFEAALEANRLTYAESGFQGIRKLAGKQTKLYLEASALLSICLLRQNKPKESKTIIRDVVKKVNNISSDRTRRKFQKRFVARIEEECILVSLFNTADTDMDPSKIHEKAVLLIQKNSEAEILKLIGNSVPTSGILLLRDVRNYSIKQLPAPDQKLLPAPENAEKPLNIGKRTLALLRRIAWKTFCQPDSEIYKVWSQRMPKMFGEGYFAAAIVATLKSWTIGAPMIASGIVAIALQYSAEEFCELAKPKGIMMDHTDSENEG